MTTKIPVELSSTPSISDSGDATAITIDSSEQVGIGTTSPNTLLHASTGSNGSGLIDVARFQNAGTTVNDGARIQLTAGTSTSGAGIGCLGVALNSAHLVFHSGGNNERMRIDSAGNVGVGTSSPGTLLHVESSATASTIIRVKGTVADGYRTGLEVINGHTGGLTYSLFSTNNSDGIFGGGKFVIGNDATNSVNASTAGLIVMDSSGHVGIGHTSPDFPLVVRDSTTSNYLKVIGATNGNAGIAFGDDDAELDGGILFKNDTKDLRFFKGGFTEAMRIDSSGNLAIGTTTSNGKINIYYSASVFGEVLRYTGSASTVYPIVFEYGSATTGSIAHTTSTTTYNTTSDYRVKENINYEFDALTRVKQLKPARFNFIADADKTVDGFIAHEVSDIVPEAITGEKDGEQMQGIDQSKLVPLLTKAIQEQQVIIEDLQTQINEVKNGN